MIQKMSSIKLIEQIDIALMRYYEQQNKHDYIIESGSGKFKKYCQIKGFDDDTVSVQMQLSAENNMLIGFDHQFPFEDDGYSDHDEDDIHKILQK